MVRLAQTSLTLPAVAGRPELEKKPELILDPVLILLILEADPMLETRLPHTHDFVSVSWVSMVAMCTALA